MNVIYFLIDSMIPLKKTHDAFFHWHCHKKKLETDEFVLATDEPLLACVFVHAISDRQFLHFSCPVTKSVCPG